MLFTVSCGRTRQNFYKTAHIHDYYSKMARICKDFFLYNPPYEKMLRLISVHKAGIMKHRKIQNFGYREKNY